MALSTGLWRAKIASSPPTQSASRPVSAPRGPPLTGASSMWIPRAWKAAWIRRTTEGALVVRSKYVVPAANPARSPCSPSATASTSAGPGSDVNTSSVAAATSRGVSAQLAPARRWGAAASRRTSWTTSSCPAFMRCDAIWRPIVPRPMNPILMTAPPPWRLAPTVVAHSARVPAVMAASLLCAAGGTPTLLPPATAGAPSSPPGA